MFLLLVNGKIKPEQDAILIAKGKIVDVGKSDALQRAIGKNSTVIDLGGRYVIPGLIDSHTHLVPYGLELIRPDLKDINSPDEAVDKIREYLNRTYTEGIVIANGYDDSKWEHPIDIRFLNQAFPDRPVAIRRICGHKTLVNSSALRLIPKKTRGINWKEGILLERPSLFLDQIFPPSEDEIDTAIEKASQKILSFGITTVHDITNRRYLKAYFRYHGHRPRIRIYLLDNDGRLLAETGIKSGFGTDDLKIMGIKLFLDGSIGARTAALSAPYRDNRTRGRILITRDRLRYWLELTRASSLQLMIHAIGDRAIMMAVDLPIMKDNPLRHRIEHAELIDNRLMDRIKEKNLMVSCQPNFIYQWGMPGGLYEKVLGRKRALILNRLKTLIDAGIKLGIGTDLMPPDPIIVIKGAQTHPNPDERIDFDTVIKYYTEGSAYLSFDENSLGRIEKKALADLVVLNSKDDFNVYMVIQDGKIVEPPACHE